MSRAKPNDLVTNGDRLGVREARQFDAFAPRSGLLVSGIDQGLELGGAFKSGWKQRTILEFFRVRIDLDCDRNDGQRIKTLSF
jgi:hypothetical protein